MACWSNLPVSSMPCAVRSNVQQSMADVATLISEPTIASNFASASIVGDVIVEGGDLFGDGVNVAARLEALGRPRRSIAFPARVQEDVRDRLTFVFDDLGEQQVKNIARPVRVYRVRLADSRQEPIERSSIHVAAPRKTFDCSAALREYERRPRAGIFRRWHGRGDHHCALAHPVAIRHRPQFELHLQRPAVDVKQVGRELGVRYVLEGSVRKAGQRVRITGQLIDAVTGTHLWADRFDGSLEDVFELQDKVASSVAGVIEPTLQAAEIRRSANRPTNDLTAYDLYLRALPHWGSFEKVRILQALDLLAQAIERDPHYGPALALAAHCHQLLAANAGRKTRRPTAARVSIWLAERSGSPPTTPKSSHMLGLRSDFLARTSMSPWG